ncbi:DNA-directed RNA polymerase subunit H [Candidatus Micrarchaeota archaeon]|nr:DNA-directed RNA polymerase subunit H [Candidatus Micrarchaeota archaeon]
MTHAHHVLVPKHSVASGSEVEKVLKEYSITLESLPLIDANDPGLAGLSAKAGDVVKIDRTSPASGETTPFYRLVIQSDEE